MDRKPNNFMQRLDNHGGMVLLIAVLVVVGGVWGFIALLDEVKEGDTQHFDRWAVTTLAHWQGPRWVQEVARDITALGGVAVLTMITLAVAVFLLLIRKYGAMWLVIIAVGGGLTISSVLKHLIERPRPDIVPRGAYVYTTSFPSGHSMLSAVVYLTLGSLLARLVHERRLKLYFIIIAMLLTFLIGVSRVYLGVHWPTDVLAGWTAGLVWAILCWLVARQLQRRGAVEKDVEDGRQGDMETR